MSQVPKKIILYSTGIPEFDGLTIDACQRAIESAFVTAEFQRAWRTYWARLQQGAMLPAVPIIVWLAVTGCGLGWSLLAAAPFAIAGYLAASRYYGRRLRETLRQAVRSQLAGAHPVQ